LGFATAIQIYDKCFDEWRAAVMQPTRRRFLQGLSFAAAGGVRAVSKTRASVINNGYDIFSGDFVGAGKDQFLLYGGGSGTSAVWFLGAIPFGGGPASWNSVANTENTPGDLGTDFWVGDFLGNGKDALIRLDSSDTRWWLGTFEFGNSTQMSWTIAEKAPILGWSSIWAGNFLGDGRDTLLLVNSDGWWLGTFPFGSQEMSWKSIVSVNYGADAIVDSALVGNFVGNGKDALLLYSPAHKNWWLGAIPFGGNQISWRTVGNWTNIAANTSFLWSGDCHVNGKEELLFYDDNYTWWLGSLAFAGDQLSWQKVGASPSSLASSAESVAWANDYFLGDDQWDLLMLSLNGTLFRGTFGTSNNQISWLPAGTLPGQVSTLHLGIDDNPFGDFLGDGRTSMLWQDTDPWQLGSFTENSVSWIPVVAPG
jgi:hypothetical protein